MADSIDISGFVNIAVAVASANGVIANADGNGRVRVTLVSNTDLFWNSGTSAVTATAADKFLPTGTPMSFYLPKGHDNIGVIRDTADGTITIYTDGG